MALYKTEGIVLRTRPLGEADTIVTLFTDQRGKIDAVARGARRPRSQYVGVSQVFTHGRYLLYEGKKDLDTLRQGEIVQAYNALREDLHKMAYASYFSELVQRMTELNDRQPDVFGLLLAVQQLLITAQDVDVIARWFELQLLGRLGFRPHLDGCVECGARDALWFSSSLGGLLCDRCRNADRKALRLHHEALEVMRFLSKTSATRLTVLKPSPKARRMLEEALPDFCAFRIGRPLHSYRFLMSLREAAGQGGGSL